MLNLGGIIVRIKSILGKIKGIKGKIKSIIGAWCEWKFENSLEHNLPSPTVDTATVERSFSDVKMIKLRNKLSLYSLMRIVMESPNHLGLKKKS